MGAALWFSSHSMTDKIYLKKKIAKLLSYTFAIFSQRKILGKLLSLLHHLKTNTIALNLCFINWHSLNGTKGNGPNE